MFVLLWTWFWSFNSVVLRCSCVYELGCICLLVWLVYDCLFRAMGYCAGCAVLVVGWLLFGLWLVGLVLPGFVGMLLAVCVLLLVLVICIACLLLG